MARSNELDIINKTMSQMTSHLNLGIMSTAHQGGQMAHHPRIVTPPHHAYQGEKRFTDESYASAEMKAHLQTEDYRPTMSHESYHEEDTMPSLEAKLRMLAYHRQQSEDDYRVHMATEKDNMQMEAEKENIMPSLNETGNLSCQQKESSSLSPPVSTNLMKQMEAISKYSTSVENFLNQEIAPGDKSDEMCEEEEERQAARLANAKSALRYMIQQEQLILDQRSKPMQNDELHNQMPTVSNLSVASPDDAPTARSANNSPPKQFQDEHGHETEVQDTVESLTLLIHQLETDFEEEERSLRSDGGPGMSEIELERYRRCVQQVQSMLHQFEANSRAASPSLSDRKVSGSHQPHDTPASSSQQPRQAPRSEDIGSREQPHLSQEEELLKQKVDHLSKTIQFMHNEVATLNEERALLKKSAESKDTTITNLESKVQELESKLQEMSSEVKTLKADIETKNNVEAELNAKLHKLSEDLQSEINQRQECEKAVEDARSKSSELEKELNATRQRLAEQEAKAMNPVPADASQTELIQALNRSKSDLEASARDLSIERGRSLGASVELRRLERELSEVKARADANEKRAHHAEEVARMMWQQHGEMSTKKIPLVENRGVPRGPTAPRPQESEKRDNPGGQIGMEADRPQRTVQRRSSFTMRSSQPQKEQEAGPTQGRFPRRNSFSMQSSDSLPDQDAGHSHSRRSSFTMQENGMSHKNGQNEGEKDTAVTMHAVPQNFQERLQQSTSKNSSEKRRSLLRKTENLMQRLLAEEKRSSEPSQLKETKGGSDMKQMQLEKENYLRTGGGKPPSVSPTKPRTPGSRDTQGMNIPSPDSAMNAWRGVPSPRHSGATPQR